MLTASRPSPNHSLLLAQPGPQPSRPHTSVFPLLWQERRVSSLEAHSVAWGGRGDRTHIIHCHGLGGQEAGKGSGTACRVRAPLSRSTWTQRAADLLTQRPLRSEHPLSPTSSTPARVSRGRTSFLSCIPCSSIQGPLEALLPGAAGAGSGPPSGPPQAQVGNGRRAFLTHQMALE